MTIRNVYKSFVAMEDLQQGVGKVTQSRKASDVQVGAIDVPYAVESQAELTALDVERFTRARVYQSTTVYYDYIYDAADLSGIQPDTGPGSWIFVTVTSADNAALTDKDNVVNTIGKYAGRQLWRSDNSRPVWATGPLPTDVWNYADGTTAVTPS